MKKANLFIIFWREMAAYFNSAIAYIFLVIFALLNGGLFMTQFFVGGRVDMRPFFYMLPFFLAVFLPAVSMRLWSEERRGNTQELLLTFPMRPYELVLGKFFASFAFYLVALACTFPVPVMLAVLGRPDAGAILGGYLGAAFLGGFFLAIGILVSGFCRDQITAFILSMMICFGLYLAGMEFVASSMDGWIPGAGTFLRHFLGAADHYDSFAKGVLDSRDALYFVVGAAVALVLNGFWIEGRMRPKAASIFATAALISGGIFLLSNWFVAGLPLGRFDVSEGQMYTISPATQKILRSLKTPVIAKLYISPADKMPTSMKSLEQDVRDKLEELRVVSDGHFQYKVFHMDPANVTEGRKADAKEETLEEQLSKKGIEPFQVESIQSDEVGVRLVYCGLTFSYKEKPEEILPRIHPGSLYELEYAIISKIYRMTLPEIPKVALVAPYEERSVDPNLMALLAQLGGGEVPPSYRDDVYELLQMGLQYEGYPVERITLDKDGAIPEGTKTLAIVEPKSLNDRQKYEINRFLCQGGSVFMAVQNYEYDYRPARGMVELVPKEDSPDVNDLLSAWGLGVDTNVLADEQSEVITLSGGGRGAFQGVTIPVKLPVQILLTDAEMNLKVSITSRLSAFFYMWGSALKIDGAKLQSQKLKAETLLHSTRNSWTVPFKPNAMAPEFLLRTAQSAKGPFPLAVLVEGQFADAYKDLKVVPEWPSAAKPAEPPAAPGTPAAPRGESGRTGAALKPAPGKLLLIGAATPFRKQLMQGGGHLNFFLNAIDILTLGDALVGVRSKGQVNRALPRISAPAKMFWRFFVMFLVPGIVALAGFVRASLRRRAKKQYLKSLAAA
ncbi:MAG TPA: Gldg family protein [Candidatus Omnitrophota bacterium]|nr:Gldg family protein [Candidatus Omnitrophota bacterium]